MTDEIKEILAYLEKRKDYVIWAGFCVYAHLGIKASPDIDIYTNCRAIKRGISKEFQERGWQKKPHKKVGFGWDWDKLEKKGTTFDIIYTPYAKLVIKDAVAISVCDYELRFLSKEWLFLTKLGQLTWEDRPAEKRKKDFKTFTQLKNLVDPKKLSCLASKLPASFWLAGQI